MKLYDTQLAPNPRRVRIFLAEKGIEIEKVEINLMQGEHRTPDYRARNPLSTVPLLELDDGTFISESVAICRYFEAIQPDPPLMGRSPKEQALIEMRQRQVELTVMMPVAMCFRHTHPALAALEARQIAEWGALNRERANRAFDWLDKELSGRSYLVGDAFSIADITALVTIDFASFARIKPLEGRSHLAAFHERVSARPSAAA